MLLSLALTAHAAGTLVDLGTLGGAESIAYDINNRGQIVGESLDATGAWVAFQYEAGTMTGLGIPAGNLGSVANAINDDGLVVGWAFEDRYAGWEIPHPVVWEDGTHTLLGGLSDGDNGWAFGVGEDGTVVGSAYNAFGEEIAVTWSGGLITDIGATAPVSRSRAYDVNAAGTVAGWGYTPFQGGNDALLWSGGAWSVVGGNDGQFNTAEIYALNDDGLAAGYANHPSGAWTATVWDSRGPRDCGNLPGMDNSELFAIDAAGRAVGRAYAFPYVSVAVLCVDDVLMDLNDLVPDAPGVLEEAWGINDRGVVVGTMRLGAVRHAFALRLRGVLNPLTQVDFPS